RFLDMFATWCLLHDSPLMDMADLHAAKQNLRQVVYNGRNTSIRLCRGGQQSTFRVWALDIVEQLAPIAELFDGIHNTSAYSNALQLQKEKILHPEQTPSAQVMEKMEARGQGFFAFAMNQSLAHRDHFRARPLDVVTRARLKRSPPTPCVNTRRWNLNRKCRSKTISLPILPADNAAWRAPCPH